MLAMQALLQRHGKYYIQGRSLNESSKPAPSGRVHKSLGKGCSRAPWKTASGPRCLQVQGLSPRQPAGSGLWTAADGKWDSKAYRWIADKTGLPFGIGKNLGSGVQRCYLLVRNSWEGSSFRTPRLSACQCPRTVQPGGTDQTKMKLNRHLLRRFFSFSSPRPLPST